MMARGTVMGGSPAATVNDGASLTTQRSPDIGRGGPGYLIWLGCRQGPPAEDAAPAPGTSRKVTVTGARTKTPTCRVGRLGAMRGPWWRNIRSAAPGGECLAPRRVFVSPEGPTLLTLATAHKVRKARNAMLGTSRTNEAR
jgi:hypothetical protein